MVWVGLEIGVSLFFCFGTSGTVSNIPSYVCYGVSGITLTSPLKFSLPILTVADTSFRKLDVDSQFWYLLIRMGFSASVKFKTCVVFLKIHVFDMFITKMFTSKFYYDLKQIVKHRFS